MNSGDIYGIFKQRDELRAELIKAQSVIDDLKVRKENAAKAISDGINALAKAGFEEIPVAFHVAASVLYGDLQDKP